MASSYALPPQGSHYQQQQQQQSQPHSHQHVHGHSSHGRRQGHAYSHSTNDPSLLSPPSKDPNRSSYFPASNSSNGGLAAPAVANGSLYTHKESSRETSPLASPYAESPAGAGIDANMAAVKENGHIHANSLGGNHQHNHAHSHSHTHSHSHSHSISHQHSHSHTNGHIHDHSHHAHGHSHNHSHDHSFSPMKSRPRGESDLGRPASLIRSDMKSASSWLTLPEAVTSLLVPLPYLLASAAYWQGSHHDDGLPPLSPYARLQKSVMDEPQEPLTYEKSGSSFVEACTLASGTLLMVGILAKIRSSERMLDRRKDKIEATPSMGDLMNVSSASKMAVRALGVGLPFYACTQIGGLRTGLVLLVALSVGMTSSEKSPSFDWRRAMKSKTSSAVIMALALCLDLAGITFNASNTDLLLGYLALACSLFVVPLPLPSLATSSSTSEGVHPGSSNTLNRSWTQYAASSPLVSSVSDVNITLGAGIGSLVLTMLFSVILSTPPPFSFTAATFSTLGMATCAAAILFAQPSALHSPYRAGLGSGCFLIAVFAFLFSPSIWPGTVFNGGLAGLSYFGVLYDTSSATAHHHHEQHDHDHAHNVRSHSRSEGKSSFVTKFLIQFCERGSLLHSILSEKDSRRIAYFTW